MPLKYRKLYIDSPELCAPQFEGDAGFDLKSYSEVLLPPRTPITVSTGIAVEIPNGAVGLVLGRSGLAFKENITVFHIGTIDSGYRGELKVLLINQNDHEIELRAGERIAQLIILPLFSPLYSEKVYDYSNKVLEVKSFDSPLPSARGINGFGSTGK